MKINNINIIGCYQHQSNLTRAAQDFIHFDRENNITKKSMLKSNAFSSHNKLGGEQNS